MVCWAGWVGLILAVSTDADLAKLDYVENVYLANYSKIDKGTIKFTIRHGFAANPEVAIGGAIDDPARAECFYRFTIENAVYSRVYPDRDLLRLCRKTGDRQISCPITNLQVLTNRKATCYNSHSPVDLAAKVMDDRVEIKEDINQERFADQLEVIVPYGMKPHRVRLIQKIQDVRDGTAQLRSLSFDETRRGRKTCKFEIARPDGWGTTFYLDMNKGGLPVEILSFGPGDKAVITSLFDDLEFVDGIAWIPRHEASFIHQGGRVHEIRITQADLVSEPAASDFTLHIAQKTEIVDLVKDVIYQKADAFSFLEPMPTGKSMVKRTPMRTTTLSPPSLELPEELPAPRRSMLWWTVGVLGIAGIVGVVVARRGRDR